MKRILLAVSIVALCLNGPCRAAPEPGQGFIDVPGGPVWYEISGDGDGLPLLVLHGGPGAAAQPLARRRQAGTRRT